MFPEKDITKTPKNLCARNQSSRRSPVFRGGGEGGAGRKGRAAGARDTLGRRACRERTRNSNEMSLEGANTAARRGREEEMEYWGLEDCQIHAVVLVGSVG